MIQSEHAVAFIRLKSLNPSERLELLEIITDFNLEARYPDENFSFHKKCTREFTEANLRKIEGIRKWLFKLIRQ